MSREMSWIGEELDEAFLKDYAAFGIYNHLLASQAFARAMESADEQVRKIFRVKLYSEFIGAIEDFAGLCIAVAGRDRMSILGTYLFFGTKFKGEKIAGPAAFFADAAADVEGEADKWLNLPGLSALAKILDADDYVYYSQGYQLVTESIRQAGRWYRLENRIAVGAYNKIKHGFVVTRGFRPEPPFFASVGDETAVLYSEPSTAKDGKLLVNGAMIDTKIGVDVELEAINQLLEAGKTLIEIYLKLRENRLI